MRTQVTIVGGGPVGLGLAIDLGQRGVEVVLLERNTEIHDIPKGQNLTQRTMEHFRVWGVEDRIRAARLMPPDYPAAGVNAYGTLTGRYAHPWFKRSQVDRYYFARNERLPQYLTERVLRERVAEMSTVTGVYGATVRNIEDHGERAVATTDDGTSVEADFVVGCDGSHSIVRESAGITETHSDHDRKMVLLVFRSWELHRILEDRFEEAAFFNVLHPDLNGYWRFLGRVDVGESWFFHAPVDSDADATTLDYETLLRESVGASFPIELDYIGFWDLRIAIADTYRKGRVFIAGDAAHSHPPYGGYGINTGLEDVRNLGWKLEAELQGWAGGSLLDTYTAERRPVFASTARDFIEAFIANDREFIARHDPERDEGDFARAWEQRRAGSNLAVSDFEPHYQGSPIVVGSFGSPGAVGRHTFEPRPGHHLPPPQQAIEDVFGLLGSGFTLLGPSQEGADSFRDAARHLDVPLDVVSSDQHPDLASYGDKVLVRPDHFVSWVDQSSDIDPLTVLGASIGKTAL